MPWHEIFVTAVVRLALISVPMQVQCRLHYATGNLTVRPHSLVNKVIYDEQKQRATGVEIIDTETKHEETFYARLIFLNASTVATAFILLNSTSSRFPNGLGNGSDQVGRNLMDHHKGL